MDIVGKIYRDFYVDSNTLDGASHIIDKFQFGGIYNLVSKDIFLEQFIDIKCLKFHTIINQKLKSKIKNHKSKLSISTIVTNNPIPTALIFDKQGKRTSYVLDDNMINLKSYPRKSKSACIFYADKFYSKAFKNYEKIYLDTAGNSYEHLLQLSKSINFKKNTVLSISKEYLTKELMKNFLEKKKFIIISHCPNHTELYEKGKKIFINNKFYINPNKINPKIKATGLGDIFFIMVSFFNYYKKISLEKSINKTQNIIAKNLILKS